jgi:Flp pilus assembly protein TadG
MREFRKLLRRFSTDERGVFAVIFALLAIVLVATAGAVVDFTTVQQARARAQDALDSAALGLHPRLFDTPTPSSDSLKATAHALLVERLADTNVAASVDNVVMDKAEGELRLEASIVVPMSFVSLVGVNDMSASVVAEVKRGSVNVEVAVALDTTGSMAGQKIDDLQKATAELIDIVVQDQQTPTYSKMALVPYSMGVNVGGYADAVRGPITPGRTITGASWSTGTARTISGASWAVTGANRNITAITKANPAVVTTSASHGYATGQTVWIAGVGGMTQVNNQMYVITTVDATRFRLNNVNSLSYSTYSSGGTVNRCQTSACEVVVSSSSHGFVNGDTVYVSGVNGMTQINGQAHVVSNATTSTFALSGTTGPSYGTYSSGGSAIKCQVASCEVVVTTGAAHGIANGAHAVVNGVSGMTQINIPTSSPTRYSWPTSLVSTTKYALTGSFGPSYGSYSTGGTSFCTTPGCQYYRYQSPTSQWNVNSVSTCVTERTGASTDVAPSVTYLGRNYPSASNPCINTPIVPLSSNKTALKATAGALTAGGSTAGAIGISWAWYMVSPNFGYLWPGDSQPAAYGTPNTIKAVILMTDGEFNSVYCNGAIAKNSTSGSGSTALHNNCDSPKGSPYAQALEHCAAIKAAGVIVYTVGFDIVNQANAQTLMQTCATDAGHAYLAATGADLSQAFKDIGRKISSLRLSR